MIWPLRVGGAIVGLAMFLIAAHAWGQQPPPREAPARDADRAEREGERLPTLTPGPPITAYPVELLGLLTPPAQRGPLTLIPSIAVSEEYNDNIFLDNRDRQSDFITGFNPALTLLVNRPAWELSAGYSFTAEIYAKESQLSDAMNRQAFVATWLYRATPRLTLKASDVFLNDRNTNITSQGPSTGRQESWSNTFTPGLTWQMTPKTSLSLGASYTALRFLGSGDGGNGEDSDTYGFRSALGYAFTPRLTGSIGYNFTYLNFEGGESSKTHNPTVGLSYRLTPTLTVSASGGPAFTETEGETSVTPGGVASLTQAFRWGSAGLQYSRSVTAAGGFGGTADTQTVSAGLTLPTWERGLVVTFTPAYNIAKSVSRRQASQVDVKALTVPLAVSYQFARYMSVFAEYTFFQQRTGSASSARTDVDQNRLRFGVQFGYPFNFD